MQAKRYKVDLQAYMAECEANYLRLTKLLPEETTDTHYQIHMETGRTVKVHFHLKERCKYTSMIDMDIECVAGYLPNNHFELRVYHDAEMVEVIAFQRNRRIQPKYDYPNKNMYQQDEKYQQHRFLSECLANCLKNGLVVDEKCAI